MSKKESPQEIAAKRFEIISPLLDPNLDADATRKMALPDWSLKHQSQSSQLQNFQRISLK